jgi:hypothetical protein
MVLLITSSLTMTILQNKIKTIIRKKLQSMTKSKHVYRPN